MTGKLQIPKGASMPVLRSKTYYTNLRSVFPDNSNRLLHAHIATICVLYEDLRIELFAVTRKSIRSLDQIEKYRPIYFLRRSIATLNEFAVAVRLLDNYEAFKLVKGAFDDRGKAQWEKAVKFFQMNETLIRDVRNDLGGHFGLEAAKYAVANLRSNVCGKLEFSFKPPHKVTPKLHFVGEIAATALGKRLSGPDSKAKMGLFIQEILLPGFENAIEIIDPILSFLLPRFQS
jgi:hypothetical protein